MMIATGAGPVRPHSATVLQRRAAEIAKPLPAGKKMIDGPPRPDRIPMKHATVHALPRDEFRAELGELRGEVERLSAALVELRSHAAILETLAHEDPLTGLLSRSCFI